MATRSRQRFFCILVSSTVAFLLLMLKLTSRRAVRQLPGNSTSNYSGFLVDTVGCKIPNINPYDELIRKFVWQGTRVHCKGKPAITFEDGVWLRINRTRVKKYYRNDLKYCAYEPLQRPVNGSDDRIDYTNEKIPFYNDTIVKAEFMRVYCYSRSEGVIYVNFHAFILPKPEIEERYRRNFRRYNKAFNLKANLNVLMVGVDSVSRLNMIRQMPRTRELLFGELGAVEMLGYNKVADNTYVNIVPMTVGKFVEELPWNETMADVPFDEYGFVWKTFSKYGYRTLYAEDAPKIAIFNYLKAGFHVPPADYYLRPFSLAIEKHKTLWNQNNNCFSNSLETNLVLDYVHRFIKSSRGKPFFAFTFITRLTHDDVNRVGAADVPHHQFLSKLKEEGHLENTVLIYYSDHGIRFGDVRGTYIGKLEERLPFMFIAFPQWFREKYPKLMDRLSTNSKRLTTPFDIYETLVDVLYFNRSVGKSDKQLTDRGISLFNNISPTRTCEHASILAHWCTCQLQERVNGTDPLIVKAARFVVKVLNSKTANHRNLCSKLKLGEIWEAWRMVPNEEVLRFRKSLNDVINRQVFYGERAKAIVDYQITLTTAPGQGLFEVTVRHVELEDQFTVMGEISRINLYGQQSACTKDIYLKKYCYCLDGG